MIQGCETAEPPDGLIVIEMSQVRLARLQDLGVPVIKVQRPDGGDLTKPEDLRCCGTHD